MEIYYSVVFFIFGIVIGSFYNVVAYRIPKNMSLIKPRSHCPKCNHTLTPLELIPVLSWLIQGGKCKNCKKKIPIFYPIFETFTGILFLLTYKIYGISIETFIVLIFISVIIISILSDILYMVIINPMLIIADILIIILKIISNGTDIIIPTIIDMLVSGGVIFIIKLLGTLAFKQEALGDGDICLLITFGIVLGWEIALFTIVLASFLALIPAAINLLKNKNHELPFGPFLGIASLICIFFQINIDTILRIIGM